MINKVILIGNLGQEPEIKVLDGGTKLARFSVATNESYTDNKGQRQTITEWHNIVAWRNLADIIEKFATKGAQVFIEGKLTHRKWQDKDGNDRYSTEVVADTFRMLGTKKEESEKRSSGNDYSKRNEKTEQPGSTYEDDLPF